MTRVLIPRSDNRNAKTIETSDFEKFFNDFLCDYIQCGMTMTAQCPQALAVDVSSGKMRIGGIYLENTASCVVTCLLPCDTNYIFAVLCRDPNSEPQAWCFQSNITGCVPTDGMILGTVTTDCSGVVACGIDQTPEKCTCGITGLRTNHTLNDLSVAWFGTGGDGCVTIACNTTLTETKYYRNLTVNACTILDSNTSPQIIFVRCTLTVNGTIAMNAVGACGGAGGAGGTSPAGNGSNGTAGCAATNFTITGGAGGTAASSGCGGAAGTPGTAGGGSGGGGNGGGSGAPPSPVPGSTGATSTATGGAGGPTTTLGRKVYNLVEYISCQTNLLAAGGGGGGGAAAGGAGGNGGEFSPNGGGGGAGGAGAVGGAGGKGGGTLIIAAQNIIVNTCGTIIAAGGVGASGGNGSNGSNGSPNPSQDAGGGGGGGGGAGGSGTGGGGGGGMLGLYYYNLTENGTISVAGGAGGTNSSTGGCGGSGGAGGPNPDGSPGQSGGNGAGATGPGEANGSSGTAGLILRVPLK